MSLSLARPSAARWDASLNPKTLVKQIVDAFLRTAGLERRQPSTLTNFAGPARADR
jgi:hypothetical protein